MEEIDMVAVHTALKRLRRQWATLVARRDSKEHDMEAEHDTRDWMLLKFLGAFDEELADEIYERGQDYKYGHNVKWGWSDE